jgi:pilus assembly protein Flp/PilA
LASIEIIATLLYLPPLPEAVYAQPTQNQLMNKDARRKRIKISCSSCASLFFFLPANKIARRSGAERVKMAIHILLKCVYNTKTAWFNGRIEDMLMLKKDRAQGLVEYAMILMLVAIVVLVVLALLGPSIGNLFSNVMVNI